MIKRIFLDLDGVVTDFFSAALKLHERQDLAENWPEGLWDMEDALGLSWEDFIAPIHKSGADFWANLTIYDHSEKLWQTCNEFAKTYICTAQTSCGSSAHGKVDFVRRWFKELGCFNRASEIIITRAKYVLAMPGNVLIDDREKNCEDFVNEGGMAILFPARTNRMHKYKNDPVGYVKEKLLEMSGS